MPQRDRGLEAVGARGDSPDRPQGQVERFLLQSDADNVEIQLSITAAAHDASDVEATVCPPGHQCPREEDQLGRTRLHLPYKGGEHRQEKGVARRRSRFRKPAYWESGTSVCVSGRPDGSMMKVGGSPEMRGEYFWNRKRR